MGLVVAGHAGFAQRHQDLAFGTELEDLVALAGFVPFGAARFPCRRAFGDPHVAFMVDEESVRPVEESGAKALDEIAVEIELQDRIDLRIETRVAVAFASAQHPQMLATGVHVDAGDDADLAAARRHLLPPVHRTIRIRAHLRGRRADPRRATPCARLVARIHPIRRE